MAKKIPPLWRLKQPGAPARCHGWRPGKHEDSCLKILPVWSHYNMTGNGLPRQKSIESTLHEIIERYQLKPGKDGKHKGFCPVHGGKSGTSFAVSLDHRGIGLKCWGGCTVDELVEVMGYVMSDMFAHDDHTEPAIKPKPLQPRIMSESDKMVIW